MHLPNNFTRKDATILPNILLELPCFPLTIKVKKLSMVFFFGSDGVSGDRASIFGPINDQTFSQFNSFAGSSYPPSLFSLIPGVAGPAGKRLGSTITNSLTPKKS